MPSNINDFIKQTDKAIKAEQQKAVSEAKKIVLETYNSIINLSPVDTGMFISNNFVTVNSKSQDFNGAGNYSVSDINKQKTVINNAKFKNNDVITIQNNLVYAGEVGKNEANTIESGHSKQAPNGVYGITEEKTRKILSKRTKI